MTDAVKNPNHYTDKTGSQLWDTMKDLSSPEEYVGYLKLNVCKYLYRYKKKNGKEDLLKCQAYLQKLIETEYPDIPDRDHFGYQRGENDQKHPDRELNLDGPADLVFEFPGGLDDIYSFTPVDSKGTWTIPWKGDLRVGTTSPSTKLHVHTNSQLTPETDDDILSDTERADKARKRLELYKQKKGKKR